MKIESEIKRKTQNFGNFYRNRKNEKTDLADSLEWIAVETADRHQSHRDSPQGDEVGRGEIVGGKEPSVILVVGAEQPPPPEPFR